MLTVYSWYSMESCWNALTQNPHIDMTAQTLISPLSLFLLLVWWGAGRDHVKPVQSMGEGRYINLPSSSKQASSIGELFDRQL